MKKIEKRVETGPQNELWNGSGGIRGIIDAYTDRFFTENDYQGYDYITSSCEVISVDGTAKPLGKTILIILKMSIGHLF